MTENLSIIEKDILLCLNSAEYRSQREVAELTGYSLGIVNRSIQSLKNGGFITEGIGLTDVSKKLIAENSPRNAVILAAGLGLRMIPINKSVTKGLIEIDGEPLIERIIKQLHEAGVKKIYIVVGFMKEQYEYLIDKYDVQLVVNRDYADKNNLHSLNLVAAYLSNTYVVPCDIWCRENPFKDCELYSWYAVSETMTHNSSVKINRKQQLVVIDKSELGNQMVGISYLNLSNAEILRKRLFELASEETNYDLFWEEALINGDKFSVFARVIKQENYFEINTYEQLMALDKTSRQLQSEEIKCLTQIFHVEEEDIREISALKKGMTNRSFLFTVHGKKYIMRIPGEGTDKLINRQNEATVYAEIRDKNICDEIIYINAKNGYKVSEYFENARCCNPYNIEEVEKCLRYLKSFHALRLKVNHDFDLYREINFYEKLRAEAPSVYKDYESTKESVFRLKRFIESQRGEKCLTHIDAVCDNFLFINHNGKEEIRLIDWEYAGMQDPHVDVAMFAVYACYEDEMIEKVIDLYFENECPLYTRYKIYAYIATVGLLWSNWCEYKFSLGVEFGEYSLKQYRYAKIYSRKVLAFLEEEGWVE